MAKIISCGFMPEHGYYAEEGACPYHGERCSPEFFRKLGWPHPDDGCEDEDEDDEE